MRAFTRDEYSAVTRGPDFCLIYLFIYFWPFCPLTQSYHVWYMRQCVTYIRDLDLWPQYQNYILTMNFCLG